MFYAASDIDWFNLQFYNQWPQCYTTFETLAIKSDFNAPKSCIKVWDGSLTDLIKNHNLPPEKLVVGKIVAQGDGNAGWVDADTLASILKQARAKWPTLRGAMGWQWGSDTSGAWANTVSSGLAH
eukprot:UC1_evm5s1056